MKKINQTNYSFQQVFDACRKGVKNKDRNDLIKRLGEVSSLDEIEKKYQNKAKKQKLYTFEEHKKSDFVFDKLTTEEAKYLYTKGLVKRNSGRKIYDKILSQTPKCPYCGEIGNSATLDHYLPKSFFPQFSILPDNLVPACRDCNSGSKSSTFPKTEDQQIIHPYFDKTIFFEEQWIRAKVLAGVNQEPYILEYYISCPEEWSNIDKKRAEKHFDEFNIAKRYGIQAAEQLSIEIDKRKNTLKSLSKGKFRSYLLDGINASFVNHWRSIMYQALASDNVFCSAIF